MNTMTKYLGLRGLLMGGLMMAAGCVSSLGQVKISELPNKALAAGDETPTINGGTTYRAPIGDTIVALQTEDARTDNPHAVTAAQLSLGTGDDVEFGGLEVGGTAQATTFQTTATVTQLQGDVLTSTGNLGSQVNFIGKDAGLNNSGDAVIGLGASALDAGSAGDRVTAVGSASLGALLTGSDVTGLGFAALLGSTSGGYNVAVGSMAGRYINAGADNTSPDNSIFIGYDSRASAATNTNEIVIGHEGRGNGSNTTTLGNASTVRTYLPGTSAIDGSAPAALQIHDAQNSGTWTAGAEFGAVDFHSADVSGSGPGVKAAVRAYVVNVSGSGVGLKFHTNDGTGLRESLQIASTGNVTISDGYLDLNEEPSPPSGTTDIARIYAEDNGSGKTRLMVQFGSGAAVQLAIEP